MARLGSWIEPFPEGIYVRPADAWIDPSQPKPRALVTHGHADHARGGHGEVLGDARDAGDHGDALRRAERAGRSPMARAMRVGEVDVGFVPAGHVLGSAQIVLEHAGERVVVSGDYKRRPDPTCAPFVPVPCDIFITEATFGLPVFRHPDTGSEIDRLLHRLHADPSRCVLVGAYALGKAQRVITELRAARPRRADLLSRRDGAAVPAVRGTRRCAWRAAAARRRDQGGDGGPDRHLPAGRAQRPLVAAAARPGDGDGLGLDAHPPARPPAQCRAAADHLRPCRLGRADPDHPRGRARAKCGSPTAARTR